MSTGEDAEIDYLKTYFGIIRTSGLNPERELPWSYCFGDADFEKLKKLAQHLESLGYRVANLFEDDDPDDEESAGEYILTVEKVEKHTPVTLARRNKELAPLASSYS